MRDNRGEEIANNIGLGANIDYRPSSDIDIGYFNIIKKATKAQCQGFTVIITDKGVDKGWKFDATVTLSFTDGSQLDASNNGNDFEKDGDHVQFSNQE